MTEKRFTLKESDIYNQKDVIFDNNIELPQSTACDLLNELNDENEVLKQQLKTKYIVNKQYEELQKVKEENEQLKSDNNRLVNETAKIVAEHQRKVLDLIDEKIEELEGRYKFGQEVYKGCPMHNIRFGINVLKELKRELQE